MQGKARLASLGSNWVIAKLDLKYAD